jgi:general secretion pathway protein K
MNSKTQSGLALVIVIWVLSLLTIMAGSFALTMRRETTVISALKDNAETLSVAETGLTIAQHMLFLADKDKRWQADGSIYPLQFQGAEIRIRIFSEQGKIDINKANEALLMKMMASTSEELDKQQELVSAIIDWRDNDDLVHINGAEKQQYEDAGLAYQPANKDFQIIEEIQMVLGMNDTIFQQIKPLITVYSGNTKVDLKVASEEVLQVVTDSDIESSDDSSQQDQEKNEMLSTGSESPGLEQTGVDRSGNDTNSVYTIISQARFYKDAEVGIRTTIKKAGNTNQAGSFQVLDYQQLYQSVSLFSDEMEQFLVIAEDEFQQEYRF